MVGVFFSWHAKKYQKNPWDMGYINKPFSNVLSLQTLRNHNVVLFQHVELFQSEEVAISQLTKLCNFLLRTGIFCSPFFFRELYSMSS
jgi:hypothetical protein